MDFNKRKIYWLCQFLGWGLFSLSLSIFDSAINGHAERSLLSAFVLIIILIGISHSMRHFVVKFKWLELNIIKVIPRIALLSLMGGLAIKALVIPLAYLVNEIFPIDPNEQVLNAPNISATVEFILGSFTYMFLLIVWIVFYYLAHFIENFRKEELKNLQWEAKISEIELNKLKSQLNPHFMFNSMNGIRALIDEDPIKAKQSVTKLSNILRNTLVMNKKKVTPFEEELQLVYDYLDVEGIRLEERLQTSFNIDPKCKNFFIPPLMLQTLVENSIKHGISTLPNGGQISLSAKVENDMLHISLSNTGKLKDNFQNDENSFGIANTIQRLNLLYGESASFRIRNSSDNNVISELIIPRNTDLPLN